MQVPLDFSPPVPQKRSKKQGHVRATSKATVELLEADGYLDARSRDVLANLRRYIESYEVAPTSAELCAQMFSIWPLEDIWTQRVLYVRRGLTDLAHVGAAQAGPQRDCRVTGRKLLTWRIVPAGGSR